MVPIVVFAVLIANGNASEEFNDMNVVCPSTGVQCISLTRFVICTQGADKIVTPPVYNCPKSYVCDDSRSSPCYRIGSEQTNEDLKKKIEAEISKLSKKKIRKSGNFTFPRRQFETRRPGMFSYIKTPIFICTSEGYFPDPANCKNYYLCYHSHDGWHAVLNTCPRGQIFSENRCSHRTCHDHLDIKVHKPAFVCSKSGKFADESDCRNYVICDRNESGVLYPRVHRCPYRFQFDKLLETCIWQYRKPHCDHKYERYFYFTWLYHFDMLNDDIVMKAAE